MSTPILIRTQRRKRQHTAIGDENVATNQVDPFDLDSEDSITTATTALAVASTNRVSKRQRTATPVCFMDIAETVPIAASQNIVNVEESSHTMGVSKSISNAAESTPLSRSTPDAKDSNDPAQISSPPRVAIICSEEYIQSSDSISIHNNRMRLWLNLANAYRLLQRPNVDVLAPSYATIEDLASFHDTAYINMLQRVDPFGKLTQILDEKQISKLLMTSETSSEDVEDPNYKLTILDCMKVDEEGLESYGDIYRENKRISESICLDELSNFGLTDDCAPFDGVYHHARLAVGGTLEAVRAINSGKYRCAIAWGGGRHHAHRESAAGFCYANDIVCGILELLFSTSPTYEKILYIDIDIHHGDGVEEAFVNSDRVFTLSLHHLSKGFYPGSGNFDPCVINKNNIKANVSPQEAKGNCKKSFLNIPFHEGLKDADYIYVFEAILPYVFKRIQPSIVIVQCGVDGLACDPFTKWSLTNRAFVRCVSNIFENCYQPNVLKNESELNCTQKIIPIILLGGGGYSNTAVSRTWTLLTALALGVTVPLTIPDHGDMMQYRPDFSLLTKELSIMANLNSSAYLTSTISYARLFLSSIMNTESDQVNMKRVPYADLYDGDDESSDEIEKLV